MGMGRWNTNDYHAAREYRAARGVGDFAYSSDLQGRRREAWRAAPALDPFGVGVREARDSAEHPNSTPIAVLFDVTGSMRRVPQTLQARLPRLLDLIVEGGYADDPQIMFGAIGDADSDMVPLQVGQFESDNRMDEQLRQIFLEGGGGGQKSESYELAAWFMAHKVATDAWEKRRRKGYLFIIGDELNKPVVKGRHLAEVLGEQGAQDGDVAQLYRLLQERWHVYYVLPNLTSYYDDPEIAEHWRELVGQGFLRLDDPEAVAELVALTIGIQEGKADPVRVERDIARSGGNLESVRRARASASVGFRPDPVGSGAPSVGSRLAW